MALRPIHRQGSGPAVPAPARPPAPAHRSAAVAAALLLAVSPVAVRGEVEPAPPDWRAQPFASCRGDRCTFEDPSGGNRYEISDGALARSADGERLYRREVAGRFETVLLAGLSGSGNQIVAAIARERISMRGRSGFSTGVHPGDVEREHRLEVINPKSGDTVKSIDLGAFRPREIALTEHGERLLVAGTDLQLKRDEVRVYNTRSGTLEHREEVGRAADIVLAADGFAVGGRGWRVIEAGPTGGVQRFNSRDPYSIAEYTVRCSEPAAGYRGRALAVRPFKGVEQPELARMLTNGLALKLAAAGFELVERGEVMDELAEELWIQASGATADEHAAELGRMANAEYLVFSELRQAGTTSSTTVRLVSVEAAKVVAGCEVSCRDCRPDDHLEALEYLVQVWAGTGADGGR